MPVSYLGGLTERIQTERELSLAEQSSLLMDLRRALADPDTRLDAHTLAARFRKRRDLLAVVGDDLDELLGGSRSRSGSADVQPRRAPVSTTHTLAGKRDAADPGLLRSPGDKKALLVQILVGAGLFLAAPEAGRRWIYPLALLVGIWGFVLAPSGLDLDLGGQMDTALDGPARFALAAGGLTYLAGIADLLLTLSRWRDQ